ncbi:hypothetical protein DH2020_004945 [Rehmannia glutinosa]|uniref:Glycosyltransferase n=1 Tax=Rehmannia glutinosa TaxID=99300 RepID=A0ABR0XRH6_REHGL
MEKPKPHGIVFPFPYQGHVTPMINLSTKLASKGFTITFVQNEFIHHSISKAQHLPPADVDLFVEARKSGLDIRYTTISDGFPPEFDRDLNYDLYWETMFQDFPGRVDEIVARIIEDEESSSRPPFFLIADTFYSWPATIAKKYNMVNVSLWTEPAIVFSVNYHLDLLRHNGHFPYSGDGGDRINYLPGVHSISRRDLMSYIQDPDVIPMLIQVVMKGFDQVKEADIILCNTVEELESETLSAQNQKHPTYSIGPINFYTDFTNTTIARSLWSESDCTQWLNSKPPGSVFRSRADRPWCNQDRVLSNTATGGFLTHCGWNSVLESIWYGVLMICYPFLVDQPTNRKLVVDDWKIGINLCDGEHVTREEVANKINVLMSGERSTEMKGEIKKVSQKLHDSLGSQGSSHRNFNRFLEDLKAKLYLRSN